MKKIKITSPRSVLDFFRHYGWTLAIQVMLIVVISLDSAAQVPSGKTQEPPPKPSAASQDKPPISLSPLELDFGYCIIGRKSDAKAVTLTNEEKKVITVDKILTKGDFSESNSCDKPLEPGKSCIISIKFVPTETDKRDGALVVNYKVQNGDTAASSMRVELRGRGSVSRPSAFLPALGIVLIYLLGLILVRWNMVARPARTHLKAHLDEALTELAMVSKVSTPVSLLIDTSELPPGTVNVAYTETTLAASGGKPPYTWGLSSNSKLPAGLSFEGGKIIGTPTEANPEAKFTLQVTDAEKKTVSKEFTIAINDSSHPTAPEVSSLTNSSKDAPPGSPSDLAKVHQLLEKVKGFIDYGGTSLSKLFDWVFWSRGSELAGWNDLHAAKVQMVSFLPVERVRAALECADTELRQVATPTAVELADKIREALKPEAQRSLDRWKALLAEARSFIYERDDVEYTILSVWHNKTMWLILCGLFLIVCLAAIVNNGVLFLVGATGGLLSRLTRSLHRSDVPTDYGAYWTSLFLSPVIGALTGWGGILGIMLLSELKILGAAITVDWNSPSTPVALGLALLLGFSERFFTSIQTSLEEKLVPPSGSARPVPAPPLSIDTKELPSSKVNERYPEMTLAASGGKPPYTWGLSSSSKLPAGLSFEGGKIIGTPTEANPAAKFTLQVTDAEKKTVSKEFMIVISAASVPATIPEAKELRIDTKDLPAGKVNVAYTETTVVASGGKPPYTWGLSSNSKLPAGLSFEGGKIIGTPTEANPAAKFTLQVTDAEKKTASKEYTIEIKT